MTIHALPARKDNYIYILENGGTNSETSGSAGASTIAVVDPGAAEPVIAFIEKSGAKLTHIFLTHHHNDHIEGVGELIRRYSPEVFASKFDSTRIPGVTRTLVDGDKFEWQGEKVEVIAVPGHTHGQIAYYWPGLSAVFPGDTLFSCGCGRLFEGTAAEMQSTMIKLRQLPPATRIYFGHEYTMRNIAFLKQAPAEIANFSESARSQLSSYEAECEQKIARGEPTTPTTVARELEINPFFNSKTVEQFARVRELRNQF